MEWFTGAPGDHGDAIMHARHPVLRSVDREHSSFAVIGRAHLGMLAFDPITPAAAERIASPMERRQPAKLYEVRDRQSLA